MTTQRTASGVLSAATPDVATVENSISSNCTRNQMPSTTSTETTDTNPFRPMLLRNIELVDAKIVAAEQTRDLLARRCLAAEERNAQLTSELSALRSGTTEVLETREVTTSFFIRLTSDLEQHVRRLHQFETAIAQKKIQVQQGLDETRQRLAALRAQHHQSKVSHAALVRQFLNTFTRSTELRCVLQLAPSEIMLCWILACSIDCFVVTLDACAAPILKTIAKVLLFNALGASKLIVLWDSRAYH
ncbi:hypothetical protein BKA62DRAFT_676958 [Auriculariales sp. MPI-PUGE-AT-0066]|nr:hypothetical protein BKA62DRAFT_676958 [Auriculariales sp. MPI-PUGE-AT-0066]